METFAPSQRRGLTSVANEQFVLTDLYLVRPTFTWEGILIHNGKVITRSLKLAHDV